MNTDDALLFLRVAESQSFKDAAAQMGISRSAASKRIALLEKMLGTMLINRSPRSISLTQAGIVFLEQCRIICEAVQTARQTIHGYGMQPVGSLQVALPTPLGIELLPMLMSEFVANYPKVDLSIHVMDGQVDVIRGGYDVVFTVAQRLNDSNLTAQRLLTSPHVLVASPSYLSRYGTPAKVQDLKKHRCLGIGYATSKNKTWRFVDGTPLDVEVSCAMTFNNYHLLGIAACNGMGFAYLPELYVAANISKQLLTVVFPNNTACIESALYCVYPRRNPPEKVNALVDFVKARLSHIKDGFESDPVSAVAM